MFRECEKASRLEKIAVADYEKAIQTAFQEIADQLAARGTYKRQLEAQNALVESNKKYYDFSESRYKNGVDTFLTVLSSQRSLLSSQQDVVSVKLGYLSNLVTLYKVLGGGQI
ncbi:TolC family protein [Desulfosarcina ovata]|uniref:TolC family protein n=1 Tax=Desulfosarcina ovata TaxID=83564 RepID=UPI0012D2C281|nr:TolC family protein [Desulfosarcina ovata]